MEKITMHTSKTYDILIEDGLLAFTSEYIARVLPPNAGKDGRKCCIVCDKTVFKLYGQPSQPLQEGLSEAGYDLCCYTFKPGEASKTIDTVSDICQFLAEHHFGRKDFLIALGGGVCGDITGFAASIYMRGISFVQIPTTLLAMSDSSVGGKTGVNTPAGKNMIGTFWQPELVLIDPKVLESLDEVQLLNGLAEVVKAGFISDATIFDTIGDGLSAAAAKAIQVKKDIVEEDERESGCRKLLNFGHTLGHAIEKCSKYKVPHGYAVMTGMYLTALAADKMKWSSEPVAGLVKNVIDAFGYPVYTGSPASSLARVAAGDKKRDADEITIVYPDRPGHCAMKTIPVDDLTAFIACGLKEAKAADPA